MREIVQIDLAGRSVSLRPTFEAYGEIEAKCGPLRQLYTSVITGTTNLSTMATIVLIGMQQIDSQRRDEVTGAEISEDGVARLLFEHGPFDMGLVEQLSNYIAALGWTPEQRKKIAAEMEQDPDNPFSA